MTCAKLLTLDQLAEMLVVSPKTIHAWRAKRLGPPALKVGRHLRFRHEDVERWLDGQRDTSVGVLPDRAALPLSRRVVGGAS